MSGPKSREYYTITVFDLRTGEFIIKISDDVKKQFEKVTSETPAPMEELIKKLYDGFIKYS